MRNKQQFHYEYVSLSLSQDELVKSGGISVFMAAMFVSGELAGTGVLALPQAVGQSGGTLIKNNGVALNWSCNIDADSQCK